MKKLVCDRCGMKLTNRDGVVMALEGERAWKAAVKANGAEPRGVFPCQHFVRCYGEMKLLR